MGEELRLFFKVSERLGDIFLSLKPSAHKAHRCLHTRLTVRVMIAAPRMTCPPFKGPLDLDHLGRRHMIRVLIRLGCIEL